MPTINQFAWIELNKSKLEKRFMKRVIIAGIDDCWKWIGSRARKYGKFSIKPDLRISAHRFSAFLFLNFDLKSNHLILHKCNNPICVNPAHLYIGDAYDNMRDRVAFGNNSMLNKTYCPSGHPYSGDNVYYDGNNHRHCKICMKERDITRHFNGLR